MTTLHAYTQHSDIFEPTLLHDYETISTLELASFPETSEDVDFKSSLRQRSYDRAQKKQARDSRFIHVRREEQRNRQKAEQRRQQLLQQQKQKQSPHDKDSKNSNSNSNNDHNKKKSDSHADRSKKRVDRHRRAEDTILALELFSDSSEAEAEAEDMHGLDVGDHSDDGYSSSRRHGRSGRSSSSSRSSCSSSSWSSTDNDDSEEGECDIANERIRFKRNLTFKTDDDGIMASTRVDSGLWKQVFVQKLDERDQARERKKDSRSRSHKKQGAKHQGSLL